MRKVNCNYCGEPAKMISGKQLYYGKGYPHLDKLMYWQCVPCNAHVGTHKNTSKPMGRLANPALRKAKSAAHNAFDPLWQDGEMSRTEAYGWLAHAMAIERKNCHIGYFNLDECLQVLIVCQNRKMQGLNAILNTDYNANPV